MNAAPRPHADRAPPAWLAAPRARWSTWWARRHPPSDALLLTQRNVYILPTGAGWLFGALLAVLLLASINYQLNLGYLLTFLLTGAVLASVHSTHAVLRDLEGVIQLGAPRPADEAAPLQIRLRDVAAAPEDAQGAAAPWWSLRTRRRRWSGGGRTRHSLSVRLIDAPPEASVWTRVPAGGETRLALSLLPGQRGWHGVPTVCLETRFPFGLLRAWSYWRPASRLLAWPVAERGAPPLPFGGADGPPTPHRTAASAPDPDPVGVRPWRRGDAAQQILWKKSAQSMAGGGDPVSREHLPAAAPELRLAWEDAALPDPEARIARLTAWVREADARGARYALRLPGDPAGADTLDGGEHHLAACLGRLATWGDSGTTGITSASSATARSPGKAGGR